MVFNRIKKAISSSLGNEIEDEYIEIDLGQEEKQNKILIKLFSLKNYEDVNEILNALREGYTIAVIDVKTLRQKDSIELKRAISKIQKTASALEGDIKGFGKEQPDLIIVSPSFAKIIKHISEKKENSNAFE